MANNMEANAGAQGGPDVSRFLEPGERIVWQGQPVKGMGNPLQLAGTIVLGIGVLLALVFTIVGFILGATASGANQGAMHSISAALLWGALIEVVTMGIVGISLIGASATVSRKVAYVLTERRAIIAQGPSYGATRTSLIDLADISTIKVIEGKNGTGAIIFGRGNAMNSANYGSSVSYYDRDYSFSNIADVMNVYHLIRQAQDGAQKVQGA